MRLIAVAAFLSVACSGMSAHVPPVANTSTRTPDPCGAVASASADLSQRNPDLGDAAEGIYFGDVISDSRGSSQSDVTVSVRRVGSNRVRVCSDYRRLPIVEVTLTRAMGTILNSSGATTFLLDRSKAPAMLDVTFNNEVRWTGTKH